ncbi:HAMP domain-containing histidine kinase [Puteibacter caeruleilacunae]|nr:HAMP domain-containing histidine kinase [Puteibacter caeruleilacunae]
MGKELLNKISWVYIGYSVLILLVLAPLFYYVIDEINLEDVEESMILRRDEFVTYNLPEFKVEDIQKWNEFNRDVKIQPGNEVAKDTVFHTYFYDELADENEPYLVLYSPITIEGKEFTYFTRIDLVETPDLVMSFVWLFLLVIVLLLIGLFFITRYLSGRLWQPFFEILKQVEQFELDKTTTLSFPQSTIQEFNQLSRSLEKLINKNTLIYKSQSEFIENAAHELQTPLAIFKAKVEELIQREDVTEGQAKELSILSNNIVRFERLNKNLLLLSRIDNDTFEGKGKIQVNDIIARSIDFFEEQAAVKGIKVSVIGAESCDVMANIDLVEVMLHNLFMNAIRHNILDGDINIHIQSNSITFSNTGHQTPLEQEKLFRRFSKGNPSQKGTGLGLSIVKKIVDQNGWQIDYNYNNCLHAFTIKF